MATNGYSPLLNSYFDDKIFPTRGQILLTEKVPRFMEGPHITQTLFWIILGNFLPEKCLLADLGN